MSSDIDFIVTWVDSNDESWLAERAKYNFIEKEHKNSNTISRYRNWDTFRYWFRGLEKFAPWVHKVHLVTCGHFPKWLNLEHQKLNLVKHSDYIPHEYLPTFNSNAIELNFHRINNLAENFVLFNDDFFLLNKVKPVDFFKNSLPCDQFLLAPVFPAFEFDYTVFNCVYSINNHFDKKQVLKKYFSKIFNIRYGFSILRNVMAFWGWGFPGFCNPHIAQAYKKETFIKIWQQEGELLHKTCLDKFRTKNNLIHWLFRYNQLVSGNFTPHSFLGKRYDILPDKEHNKRLYDIIKRQKHKVICVNDAFDVNFDYEQKFLIAAFDSVFPQKCSFEK